MTAHELKIWLTTNGYTQKTLSEALGVTIKTMNTWCNNRPPQWLPLALDGLGIEINTVSSFVDMCGLNATDSYLLIGTVENIKQWCEREQRSHGYMHYVVTKTIQEGVKTLSDRPVINLGVK